jgi:hypothetical protein
MVSAQTPLAFVGTENRFPLFRIMLGGIFSWEWCFDCATAQRAQQDAGFNVSNRGYDVDQTFARFQPIALSLFRFITGLLLFQYGVAKLLKFPAGSPLRKSRVVLSDRRGRRARTGARRVADDRLVFAHRRLHPVGRNGVCLFHRTLSAQLLSALQQRHRGGPVLLCLPLSGDVRRRPVQR